MSNIIITGAHGFIGRHLSQWLAQQGHQVAGLGHGGWSAAEASSWGPDSDPYGRSPAASCDTSKVAGRGDDNADNVTSEDASLRSNHISFVVTGGHDVYCMQGRQAAPPSRDIAWEAGGFRKCKAETLFEAAGSEDGRDALRFMCKLDGGLASGGELPVDLARDLGLGTPARRLAFCEVYGFYLGDGSLAFKASGACDAVSFRIVKASDMVWLKARFAALGLELGKGYTETGAVGSGDEVFINVTDDTWTRRFLAEHRHACIVGDADLSRPTPFMGAWVQMGEDGASRNVAASSATAAEAAAEAEAEPAAAETAEAAPPAAKRAAIVTAASSDTAPESAKSAKRCATWVWHLRVELARGIVAGLHHATGSEMAGQNTLYTSSARFRDELVRLCLHAGYAARFYSNGLANESRSSHQSPRESEANDGTWAVSYVDGPQSTNPVLFGKRDIKPVPYSGRTWCVSLPHGLIITRRAHADAATGTVLKASLPIVMGNCLIGYGASALLLERLMYSSDAFEVHVCKVGGTSADAFVAHVGGWRGRGGN